MVVTAEDDVMSQESLEETDCVLRQPSVPSLSPFSHSWSSRWKGITKIQT